MGRRYRIEIALPSATTGSGAPVAFGQSGASQTTLPGALQALFPLDSTGNTSAYQVDFDLSLTSNGTIGSGNRMLTIWGVDPAINSQVNNLNFAKITVYGGFDKGMPLSTMMAPLSTAPILTGIIFGAWGNFIGTQLYICLPIISMVGAQSQTPNLSLYGKAGTPLSTAIRNAFNIAFPKQDVVIDISSNLVLQQDMNQSVCHSLEDFTYVVSQEAIRQMKSAHPNYQGIKIGWKGTTLLVSDKVTPQGSKVVNITAAQLLGSPVWSTTGELQVTCPMRSDIQLLDTIKLPQTPTQQTAAGPVAAGIDPALTFDGSYQVIEIRHLGLSRSADALSWATILTCVANPITSTNKNAQIGATISNTTNSITNNAPVAFGN